MHGPETYPQLMAKLMAKYRSGTKKAKCCEELSFLE